MAELQIINYLIAAEAKELMGNKFSLMIKYFIEDTASYMLEIKAGITNNEAGRIIGASHTIKSSSKQIGAERISEIAEQIETLCRKLVDSSDNENDFIKISSLYQALEEEIEIAIPELNKLC